MPSKKELQLLSRIKSGLLTDNDIKLVVARMHSALSPDVLALMKEFGVDPDITIRLSTFGSKCRQRREALGWDLKRAAETVGVPRYRIDAIESGSKSSASQKEVERYVATLGVNDWFQKWKRLNRGAFKWRMSQTSWVPSEDEGVT